jgi:CheY-like chemotaxis protein
MPQASGFSVVEAILQAHPVPPPMSLLTTSPNPGDVERAKALGVLLLPKPADVDATVNLLRTCVDASAVSPTAETS